ncbi:MAG: hypothetical protein KF837_33960 [Labilithrix sp.]|nr:hypothetical protein [Labilithrix sp.]
MLLESCVSQPECNSDTRSHCKAWLEQLLAEIPTVILDAKEQHATAGEVAVVPDSVAIDGERVTDAEVLAGHKEHELDPGEHTFVFRRAGAQDVTLKRDIRASRDSKRIAVPVLFRPLPVSIRFDVKERQSRGDMIPVVPEAILIDGAPVRHREAMAGIAPYEVAPGKHTFVFMRAGSAPVSVEQEIAASPSSPIVISARFEATRKPEVAPSATVVEPAPEPKRSGTSWGAIGLGTAAVGAVGLGLGVYFGAKAMSLQNDAKCPENKCGADGDPSVLRDAKSAANVSTALFVAGGILGIGGLAILLLSPSPSSAATVRLRSVASGEVAGAVLEGAF